MSALAGPYTASTNLWARRPWAPMAIPLLRSVSYQNLPEGGCCRRTLRGQKSAMSGGIDRPVRVLDADAETIMQD